jgi:hypothetical protein
MVSLAYGYANKRWQTMGRRLAVGNTAGKQAGDRLGIRGKLGPAAGFIVGTVVFAAVFVAVVVGAFHAPSPRGLPVGIVAPATVTGQVEEGLSHAAPGGFDLRIYGSEAAARSAITHNELDGALIDAGSSPRLLMAQADGTAVAQTVSTAFDAIAARSGQALTVTDVVPPLPRDSMALSPFFVVLGVLFPGLAAGVVSALLFRRGRAARCVAALAVAAVGVGAAGAGIADGIAGLGHYLPLAGIITLFALAVAIPTAALARIRPPLAAAALLVFVVLGIPASGGPSGLAPFVPGFIRVLHPALPLGLATSAVRGAVYFGGYGVAGPLWTLATWALAGLAALTLVTARRPEPGVGVPVQAGDNAGVTTAAASGFLSEGGLLEGGGVSRAAADDLGFVAGEVDHGRRLGAALARVDHRVHGLPDLLVDFPRLGHRVVLPGQEERGGDEGLA